MGRIEAPGRLSDIGHAAGPEHNPASSSVGRFAANSVWHPGRSGFSKRYRGESAPQGEALIGDRRTLGGQVSRESSDWLVPLARHNPALASVLAPCRGKRTVRLPRPRPVSHLSHLSHGPGERGIVRPRTAPSPSEAI